MQINLQMTDCKPALSDSENRNRLGWVDNAKAIGIILIVFGHTIGFGDFAHNFIYSFHIPLFFFLSGYLVKVQYLDESFFKHLKRNITGIIVPYAAFWFISYLLWIPTRALRNPIYNHIELSILDPVVGLFYGAYPKLYINEVLWFFPCLFIVRLIFFATWRIRRPLGIVASIAGLAVLSGIGHGLLDVRLPWNAELAMIALVFYGGGFGAARITTLKNAKSIPIPIRVGAIGLLTGFLCIIVALNGSVNMNRMTFGNWPLFYMGAACGIMLILLVSQLLENSVIARWLSENTIIIFPIHKIAFNVFTGIGVVIFKLSPAFKDTIFFSLVFTAGALVATVPFAFMVHRYLPWMAGRRSISLMQ